MGALTWTGWAVVVCLLRPTTGRATISDNGYDNLVVAISPDVRTQKLTNITADISGC